MGGLVMEKRFGLKTASAICLRHVACRFPRALESCNRLLLKMRSSWTEWPYQGCPFH
jgi:hypothetical protein